MHRKRLAVFLVISILCLNACSHSYEGFSSLKDQGILPLSTANPYVGANLYLSDEFEKSSDLFNFLKARGAPSAIELSDEGSSTSVMKMFYVKEKEVYVADLSIIDKAHQWLVRGPFAISRNDYRKLPHRDTDLSGEPVFAYGGKPYRFKEVTAEEPRTVVTLKMPEEPKGKRDQLNKWKQAKEKAKEKAAEEKAKKAAEVITPMNFDQRALEMSKGFVERAPNGDLVHTVQVKGTTVEKITKWYTGSDINAEKIAGLNNVTEKQGLEPGIRIHIPSILAREFKVMPKDYK